MLVLAKEDVITDRCDALQVPTRRYRARMEEKRVSNDRVLQTLIDDLGDRDCSLPLPIVMRHVRQRMAVNERELPALEQNAAISGWEPPTAFSAIGDHLPNGELASERLALGLEIDACCKAIELVAPRLSAAQVGNHCSEILGPVDRRPGKLVRILIDGWSLGSIRIGL